jgi:hypothetical protein
MSITERLFGQDDPGVSAAYEAEKKAQAHVNTLAEKLKKHCQSIATKKVELERLARLSELDETPEASATYNAKAAEFEADKHQETKLRRALSGASDVLIKAKQELHEFNKASLLKTGKKLTVNYQDRMNALGQSAEQFAETFRAALKGAANLRAFYPHGTVPLGSMASTNEILHALKIELFRLNPLSPTERGDHLALLPGADSGMLLGAPQHIPSLSAKAAEAMAFLLRLLEAGPMAALVEEPAVEDWTAPVEEPTQPEPAQTFDARTYVIPKIQLSAER